MFDLPPPRHISTLRVSHIPVRPGGVGESTDTSHSADAAEAGRFRAAPEFYEGIVSRLGARERKAVFSGRFFRWGRGDVAWIVRLVSLGAEGEEHSTDVLQIAKPRDLTDLASLGLTLAEGKRLLAGVQQELVAAQARVHAVRRPECRSCGVACRVKDYRQHAIATLFGRVTVRLPRFRCADCGTIAAGMGWPPHARSTPELDRLRSAALRPADVPDGGRGAGADVPG